MSKPRSVLFITSLNITDRVGGHHLSAVTLANGLVQRGYRVGFLMGTRNVSTPEFDHSQALLHSVYYPGHFKAFFTRPWTIYHLLKEYDYRGVVALDQHAILHASWAIAYLRHVPLIQVMAGGKARRPVLRLPGILVFSEELYDGLLYHEKCSSHDVWLSAGRVDFSHWNAEVGLDSDLGFSPDSPRVLLVSRLSGWFKIDAVHAFLDQVGEAAREIKFQCVIIGDGDARPELEEHARAILSQVGNRVDIRFLGTIRVQNRHLRQADLVIGQGRSVIEAMASRVPAAVCGADGYFGLLTPDTLPLLAKSNLTGRGLQPFSDLRADLSALPQHKETNLEALYNMALERYDVSRGVDTLEQILEALVDDRGKPRVSRWRVAWAYWRRFLSTPHSAYKKLLRGITAR